VLPGLAALLLSHANLEGANVASGQLSWRVSLEVEAATVPDGTKHEKTLEASW